MVGVLLRDDLNATLEQNAREFNTSVEQLVNEAVEYYLRIQQQEKLDREITAYEQMHPDLVKSKLGMWIAIHNGKLIDNDTDGATLYQRIRGIYGRTSILIRQVQEEPVVDLQLRTPNTGKKNEIPV